MQVCETGVFKSKTHVEILFALIFSQFWRKIIALGKSFPQLSTEFQNPFLENFREKILIYPHLSEFSKLSTATTSTTVYIY